jgi:hypothetical protein
MVLEGAIITSHFMDGNHPKEGNHMRKFIMGLLLVFGFLTFAADSEAAPAGWDGQGTITHFFIGDAGAYGVDPMAIVVLSDNTKFIFNSTSNVAKLWVSELLTARANGQLVTIQKNGTTDGYGIVYKVWIQ